MRNVALVLSMVCLAAAFLVGCRPKETGQIQDIIPLKPDYSRPLPPGQLGLRKLTDPADIPDFTSACGNLAGLRQAIANSLHYLSKPSSQKYFPYGDDITHTHAVTSLKAFDELLASGASAEELNRIIREKFDVYISVGWDGEGTVLFTGYYTPIFDASPVRTDTFRYPLYKQPADLVKDAEGQTLGRKGADGTITPYPTRREIEGSKMMAGQELYWMADEFEVYIAHVQGSAILRLPDGGKVNVGYTATSGHDYVSVGKAMVKDGKMSADGLSLRAMIDYFKANPHDVRPYTWRNPRYVFFAETSHGTRGSLNEPVIPRRSVATDKSIFPRACLMFLSTKLPRRIGGAIEMHPYRGFALDQDTGGAIRAPGRCDLYMGIGDEAGELAGRVLQEGRMYYLFLSNGSE